MRKRPLYMLFMSWPSLHNSHPSLSAEHCSPSCCCPPPAEVADSAKIAVGLSTSQGKDAIVTRREEEDLLVKLRKTQGLP